MYWYNTDFFFVDPVIRGMGVQLLLRTRLTDSFYFSCLLIFISLQSLYSLLITWRRESRFAKFQKQHGCSLPHRLHNVLPWGLERVYNVFAVVREGKDILDDLITRGQRESGYTSESVGFGGRVLVATSEPENFKTVLATNFKDFEQGSMRHSQFGPLLGKSILNSDGPFWEHSRAVLRPQFARDQINDLGDTERSTQMLMQAMPSNADGWAEADLSRLFFKFTLDTGTAFLFGKSVDSLSKESPTRSSAGQSRTSDQGAEQESRDSKFEDAVSVANSFLTMRIRLQGLYWISDSLRFRRAVAYARQYVSTYVDAALQGKSASQGRKYDLSTSLAMSIPNKDSVEIRDQLLSVLVAARDTTAALLNWLFVELSRRPEIYQKLRQEILDDFGLGTEQVNFENLKNATYLQNCLRETLRFWPAVPLNNRLAVRDTVLPRGGGPGKDQPIAIRKGTTVFLPIYTMHRRKDLWGPDADEWKPERWTGRKQDWNWVPFSGGPRVCLGQQYALTEAAYLTVRLLQKYDRIEWMGPPGTPKKTIGLSLVPADGVPVRLREAAA